VFDPCCLFFDIFFLTSASYFVIPPYYIILFIFFLSCFFFFSRLILLFFNLFALLSCSFSDLKFTDVFPEGCSPSHMVIGIFSSVITASCTFPVLSVCDGFGVNFKFDNESK
jgi:hypothetical protein